MQATVEALRVQLTRHNRRVLRLALLTIVVCGTLWSLLYGLLYWLALLGSTAIRGLDADAPKRLPALFLYGAGLSIALAYCLRRIFPDESPRAEKSIAEHVVDLLLALPRATLAIWGNLSAWRRLSPRELESAALLVRRLQCEPRVPLHNVPLDLPARRSRSRIVLALQMLEVIRVERIEGTVWLSVSPTSQFALPSQTEA